MTMDPAMMLLDSRALGGEIAAHAMKMDVVGAYSIIFCAIHLTRRPLPDDKREIARLIGCTPAKWLTYRAALATLLIYRDGLISHGRTEQHLRERGLWAGDTP